MTTITIEQELLEQAKDAFAKVIEWDARRDYLIPYKVRDPVHAAQKKIDAALAAPATAPEKTAWHDAPTVPGVWLCDEGDICYTWTAHNIEILDQFDPGDGLRWYGPIPEDRQ